MHIDHTTIRTNYLKETRDFFVSVFNLEEGKRPAVIASAIEGYWLYHQQAPLLHLIRSGPRHQSPVINSAEAIDHVAFKLEGYTEFKQKLERLGIPYTLMALAELHEQRVFIRTPMGLLVEAVFRNEE